MEGGKMSQEVIDLLNKLTKEELINIVDQEKRSLEEKGVTISKSWPKTAVINSLIAALDKKTIKKYVSVSMEVEEEIERTTVEKIKRKTKMKVNQVTLSKSDLVIALAKYEPIGLTTEIIHKEAKHKGYEVYDRSTLIETLEPYPKEFLFYLYNLLKKRGTGKGLEYRFANWMKTNFKVFEQFDNLEDIDKFIKYRHKIRGHDIDVFSYFKRKRLPGYSLFLIQCKDWKGQKINKNIVSNFKGIVEDIISDPSVKDGRRIYFIIVSSSGFVQSAIDFAQRNPIKTKVKGKIMSARRKLYIRLYEEIELGTFKMIFPLKK